MHITIIVSITSALLVGNVTSGAQHGAAILVGSLTSGAQRGATFQVAALHWAL